MGRVHHLLKNGVPPISKCLKEGHWFPHGDRELVQSVQPVAIYNTVRFIFCREFKCERACSENKAGFA